MKKIFMVLVMVSALFCGCGKEEGSDASEYYNEISKAQEIIVVSADTSSVIQTLSSKEDIGDFTMALDMVLSSTLGAPSLSYIRQIK